MLDTQFDIKALSRNLVYKDELLDDKYILVFQVIKFRSSELFTKFSQSYIYYSINQVLNRIPKKFYCDILLKEMNKYEKYYERVHKTQSLSDNRLSVFDLGIDNIQYCFIHNHTFNQIVQKIISPPTMQRNQIKNLIFQNQRCQVRHMLRKEDQTYLAQKELENKFRNLFNKACSNDETYRLQINKLKDGLYAEESAGDSDEFEEEGGFGSLIKNASPKEGGLDNLSTQNKKTFSLGNLTKNAQKLGLVKKKPQKKRCHLKILHKCGKSNREEYLKIVNGLMMI